MTEARNVWMRQHLQVSARIPDEWIVVVDGQPYIHPDHRDEPLVKAHNDLLTVGYAKGWI